MSPAAPAREAAWPGSQWNDAPADSAASSRLAAALGLRPSVARILAARGFSDPEEAAGFLNPRLASCLMPDRLPGIARAATVVGQHVGRGDRVVVFGDFDADGMTASTILRTALAAIGSSVAMRNCKMTIALMACPHAHA